MQICKYCLKETPAGSRFCQNCGRHMQGLAYASYVSKIARKINFKKLKNNLSKIKLSKQQITVIGIIVVSIFIVPKANAYFKVNSLIKESITLQNEHKYAEAAQKLSEVEKLWTIKSKKIEVARLQEANQKYSEYALIFKSAQEKVSQNKLQEAKTELQKIELDFPEYGQVKGTMIEVQDKIEQNLQEEIKRKEEEAKKAAARAASEAKRQAQEKATAIARAEANTAAAQAQANAAAAEKARADAAAAAAERSAREAQARADAIKNEQTNEYINKWNRAIEHINTGRNYISQALDYLSSGSYTSSLSYLTYGLTSFNTASSTLGNDYIPEMATSHMYLLTSINYYAKYEAALFDAIYYLESSYLTQAWSYRDQADNYASLASDYIGKY